METNSSQLNALQYESPNDFFSKIEKASYIENPLNELASSSSAIIYYGAPCCTLRCCIPIKCSCDCADYYNYNTLAVNGGVEKYLFKNNVKLDCNICCSNLFNRFAYCKSISLSSYNQYSSDSGVETVEMIKENKLICVGICSYYLDVFTKPDNNLVGIIQFKGCCRCDYDCCKELCEKDDCCCGCSCGCSICCNKCEDICFNFFYCCDILTSNKDLVYTIFLRKCCFRFYPIECCEVLTFIIKTPDGTNVGKIEGRRNCCNCYGVCGANFTYTIDFPKNATPQMKLTIINAVIAIDIFYV